MSRPGERRAGYPLLAIAGPTASGKSALALYLATLLDGEVINYDSVQIYRGLDIGSGKLRIEERLPAPHHLLDVLEPHQTMTAGHFRRLALEALEGIRERGKLPILVGGAGFYLRSLLDGLFEGPTRSEVLRSRLRKMEARRGKQFLHALLSRMDPAAASRIHPHDAQKVIRAAEVCLLAGKPISALHSAGMPTLEGFRILKAGLNPDRAELLRRIDQRVESMFDSGLLREVGSVLAQYGSSIEDSGPLNALGYRQARRVLRGEMSLSEARLDTQAATRRYAKRQMTWFRREPGVTWFKGFGDDPPVRSQVAAWMRHMLSAGETGTGPARAAERNRR
ncbi:MAG: tRNA (adenosine(37)-N6)-dimethylallyltransferase MiaA [Terriglobia bacterium]